MKNSTKLAGIIVIAAIIGFSFTACGNGTTDGGGWNGALTNENLGVDDAGIDWKNDTTDYQFSFTTVSGSLWLGIFTQSDNPGLNGAVTITGNTITWTDLGVTGQIYLSDNLQRIKIEGLTDEHKNKNGEFRKRS